MFKRTGLSTLSLAFLVLFLILASCGAPEPTSAPIAAVNTNTPVPPTDTPMPPTDTAVPPTETAAPPTDTPVPPTSTPTPEPPTATPSPTAKPTLEAKTQATSAEEIVGEYWVPGMEGGARRILALGEDGSFSIDGYNKDGGHEWHWFDGTWWFEDAQLKIEYRGKCQASSGVEEGFVAAYRVDYRMMGGDKPARLYFTPVDDQCVEYRTLLREGQWNRNEP